MSTRAAFILQGKHTPLFRNNKVENKDKIVIVNARYTKLTGKKLLQKKYYKHSSYPGNLQEITAKDYLLKNPSEMVKLY